MADATALYQQRRLSWLRVWPPRPTARTAVVLERRGGYQLVTRKSPADPFGFIRGRYRQAFRVELAPLQVTYEGYELPSKELARAFRADFRLTVEVSDPVKVVQEQQTNAWEAIEPVLRLGLRQIGRSHATDEVARVEEELHEHLTNLPVPQAGLRVVRGGVTVHLEVDDLKRARQRIDEEHQRDLDALNAVFRVTMETGEDEHRRMLEQLQAQHNRVLDRAHESHHRELEAQRRELIEGVMGDEVLPKLLLIKLGARPSGSDPKEIDEVIELMRHAKFDDFNAPFELLHNYRGVIERWQLEEPVNVLLKRLLDSFEPRPLPQGSPSAGGQEPGAASDHGPAEKTTQDGDPMPSNGGPPSA